METDITVITNNIRYTWPIILLALCMLFMLTGRPRK